MISDYCKADVKSKNTQLSAKTMLSCLSKKQQNADVKIKGRNNHKIFSIPITNAL